MTGNGERNRVGGAGSGHSTGARWLAERSGDLGVAASLAPGYRLEGLPDALLKGGRTNVQGKAAGDRVFR